MSGDTQRELRKHIDPAVMSELAREIAFAGAQEFGDQDPAYATDIQGDTCETVTLSRPIRPTAAATMTSLRQWCMERGGNLMWLPELSWVWPTKFGKRRT